MPHYDYQCHGCGGTTLFLLERVIAEREKKCTHCGSFDILLVAYYRTAQDHIVRLRELIDELEVRIEALESGDEPCQAFPTSKPN
jgi:DNA-directed RNA polymerase subunit RPC12/RpoP